MSRQMVTLSLGKIVALDVALKMLDTYERVVGEGEKAKTVRTPYEFPGDLAWNIARNMSAVAQVIATYNSRRNALIKQFDEGTGTVVKANEAMFYAKHAELLSMEEEVSLALVDRADFKVGKPPDGNPIQPSVLVMLEPMILPD